MTEFEQAYQAWIQATFPPEGRSEDLGELHADMSLVDTWVADSLVPYVKHGKYVAAKVDVLKKLTEIRDRAAALIGSESIGTNDVAETYVHYADLLENAYERFLQLRPR